MKRVVAVALALGCLVAAPAVAALKPGAVAPDFTAPAAVGGQEFTFSLAKALKKGPVVLYFFPKAFTKGCTAEAHEFAAAADRFAAEGATLIGMSADDIGTLHKFSSQECSAKFPVAADPDLKVIRAYDAALVRVGSVGIADRISYVIAPDDRIVYAYADRNPDKHVENTLAAVRELEAKARK
ncbi:peroxiredoxin [Enhydrobacter sp.]|jgi:peroxiredoxin|uniref:peroxiredoxin n=1 Tax=Enhydrobacter sp. TaxID=1894999 RepID=UPI0026393B4D|nr:peroxiredoxin [Enhydrobacter sp.]WIM13699.1 MAG: Alkyl hydroperoxide reductase subunit C-like protein [Enhydrobacter sp.]